VLHTGYNAVVCGIFPAISDPLIFHTPSSTVGFVLEENQTLARWGCMVINPLAIEILTCKVLELDMVSLYINPFPPISFALDLFIFGGSKKSWYSMVFFAFAISYPFQDGVKPYSTTIQPAFLIIDPPFLHQLPWWA
jgi:hypothetical protein